MITTGTIDLLGIVSASQALSSETSIDRLHAHVVQVLSAMTGATGVHLLLWDEDRKDWLLPAPGGGTVPATNTGQDRAAPMSVLRYVKRTGEPLVVGDATGDDRFARDPYFADVDCCSLVAVPVLSRGVSRAVLLLENRLLGGAFTAGRLDAVNLIAGQLAVSLDNAQLYAGFGQVAGEQAALRRVAVLVAQAAPPEAVFAAVAAEAGRLLGVDVAVLIRYDPRDSITAVGAWTSTGAAPPTPVGSQFPLGGNNASTLVFRTGQTARTEHADLSGVIGDVATQGWGLRSSVGVPIRVEDRLWGAMVVASIRRESLPADAEARLTGFTELVATAIANTQAQVELQSSADEQAALRRVATLVARSAPEREVLAAVTEETGRLLHAHHAVMGRYDSRDSITVVASWSGTGAAVPVGSGARLGGRNVSTLVFHTGQPARIDDYADASGPASVGGHELGLGASVGVPISVEGRLWGAMSVAFAGEPLPTGTEERLAAFTELAATAIANAQARTELREFAAEQAALRRAATLVARAAPPEEVFAAVTAEAGRLLDADMTGMTRYDPEGGHTLVGVWASTGAAVPVPIGTRFGPGGRNTQSLVFQTGQPARIDDYGQATGPIAQRARELGARAAVGAPITVEGRLWGVVSVSSKRGPLPAGTEARLTRFTELTATAIANAEARAAVTASRARIVAATDAARRRIERDLHDGVQQRLVTQALMLSGIGDRVPADVRADVDQVRDEMAATRQELRDICQGVHPSILVELGLGAAIRDLGRRSPLPVRAQLRAGRRLPGSCEVTAYYVAAEAFTNAAKHANASAVDIVIEEADGMLRVQVRDDGAGGADASRGSGLTGLRDRVEAVGGTMTLDSPAGAGTVLTVLLPITADDH